MDKFAEFVSWSIPVLYETKTQNAGEFTYFVSDKRGISKYGRCIPMFPLSTLRLSSPVLTPLLDKRLIT